MKFEEKETWMKYAHVVSSKNKIKIVRYLITNPSTPTNISRSLNIDISIVSRLLKNMKHEGLVKCLNPDERKGKLFYLTEAGNWVSKHLEGLK